MKKFFAIVAVAAFVFAACGQKQEKTEAPADSTATQTEQVVEEQVVEEVVDTTAAVEPTAEVAE